MDTIVELYGETYDLADIKYIKKIKELYAGRFMYGIKIHFINVKPTNVWLNSESQRDHAFSMLIKIMNKVKAKRGY